jgi:hypothetical protein
MALLWLFRLAARITIVLVLTLVAVPIAFLARLASRAPRPIGSAAGAIDDSMRVAMRYMLAVRDWLDGRRWEEACFINGIGGDPEIRRADAERELQFAKYKAEYEAQHGRVPRRTPKAFNDYMWARMRLDVIASESGGAADGSDEWKAANIYRIAGVLPEDQVAALCETGHLRLVE